MGKINPHNISWVDAMQYALMKFDYEKSSYEYRHKNALMRFWLILTGRKPKDPVPGWPSETLASIYVRRFNEAYHFGCREDLDNGATLQAVLRYQSEDRMPVLTVTYYEDGTAWVEKMKFLRNGGRQQLPASYPYSEFAINHLPYKPAVESLETMRRRLPGIYEEIAHALSAEAIRRDA